MAAFEGGEIVLYEARDDYHSQVARMVLLEKGVKYTSKIVDEDKLENYEPSYLKLNPKATLPTVVCGGTVITDPREQIEWITALPVGRQPLKPPPESYMARRYDEFFELHYERDIRSFSLLYRMEVCGYSKEGSMLKITKNLAGGLKKLKALQAANAHPDLAEAVADLIVANRKTLHDMRIADELFEEHSIHVFEYLDYIEGCMETNEEANMWDSWLCGPDDDSFTVADVLSMALLARCWWCKFARRHIQARPRAWQYWKRIKERSAFLETFGVTDDASFRKNPFGPPLEDEENDVRGIVLEEELRERPLGGYVAPWKSALAPQGYHSCHYYKVFTKVATVREGPRLDSPIVGEIACKTVVCGVKEWMIPVDPKSWEPTPIRIFVEAPVAGWISTKALEDLETWDDIVEPGPFEGTEYFNNIQGYVDKHRIKKAYDYRHKMGYKYYAKPLKVPIPNYHQFGKYSGIKVDPIPRSKYIN